MRVLFLLAHLMIYLGYDPQHVVSSALYEDYWTRLSVSVIRDRRSNPALIGLHNLTESLCELPVIRRHKEYPVVLRRSTV